MSLIPRTWLFENDNLFDSLFAPATTQKGSEKPFFAPRVDLKENNNHYELSAEIPGVKKEDIHITLDNGLLSIEAECKQEEKEEKEGRIIRQERRYGKFVRSFTVGDNVKEADINAAFENGILTVKIPKVVPTPEKPRRIAVS